MPVLLEGRFLAAVWDGVERRLLLAHDAGGHHPVFLHERGQRLWFSPNVLALAHSGAVDRRPDRISFAMMLRLTRPEAGHTFFEGIERLGYPSD